jgi:hypothetical protein
MARLLNRPMSSSTALSNLLGQRGQQEAQMSLARTQPWTSAITNMGKMTAQSLASKYAADKARPAEALKMMSQIETMQSNKALREYREAQLKTEGQTSARSRAAMLLNNMSYAEPQDQAKLYAEAAPLLQQAGLGSLVAPAGFKAGTPEAFIYARRTAGLLDKDLVGQDAADRLRHRVALQLGRDPKPEEIAEQKQKESAPTIQVVKGLVNFGRGFEPSLTYATMKGTNMGHHWAMDPASGNPITLSGTNKFQFMPTAAQSNAKLREADFKLLGGALADGLVSTIQFSPRELDEIIPWAMRAREEAGKAPINFSLLRNMEAANYRLAQTMHGTPIVNLTNRIGEYKENLILAKDQARILGNIDVEALNLVGNELAKRLAGNSELAQAYQRFIVLNNTLVENVASVIAGGGVPSDKGMELGQQMFPANAAVKLQLAGMEAAAELVTARENSLNNMRIWTAGGSMPTRGSLPLMGDNLPGATYLTGLGGSLGGVEQARQRIWGLPGVIQADGSDTDILPPLPE